MASVKNIVCDLETQIRWIEDIECHKFPGWANVTCAMKEAIEKLNELESIINLQHDSLRGSADTISLFFKMFDNCIDIDDVKKVINSGVTLDTKADKEYVCSLIDELLKKGVKP